MQFNQQKPIYLQIADYMIEQILTGTWFDGSRIPSVRDMAVEMEVNPNTVTRTYTYLQEQGIITMQRGIGYFISDQASAEVRRIKRDEFISVTAPEIVRLMHTIGISIEEFVELYHHHRQRSLDHENK